VVAWHLAESLESCEVLTVWDRGLQNEQILERPKDIYPRSLRRVTQLMSPPVRG